MYELELKMDEYILYDNTTYKRKDGMDEKLKPKWVNKRWSSKNGLPDYWGGCDEEGEEFIENYKVKYTTKGFITRYSIQGVCEVLSNGNIQWEILNSLCYLK